MSDSIRTGINDGIGAAQAANLVQAGVRGASNTGKVGTALSLASGASDLSLANVSSVSGVGKAAAGAAGTATNAAELSNLGSYSNAARTALPHIAKGASVIGAATSGYQLGTGINNVYHGNYNEGKEQVVAGTCDMVSAFCLAGAAGATGTVFGAPAAPALLVVAGGAQLTKYGYQYGEDIYDGAVKYGGMAFDAVTEYGGAAIHTVGEYGSAAVDGTVGCLDTAYKFWMDTLF